MCTPVAGRPHVDHALPATPLSDSLVQGGEGHVPRGLHSLAVVARPPACREDVNPGENERNTPYESKKDDEEEENTFFFGGM